MEALHPTPPEYQLEGWHNVSNWSQDDTRVGHTQCGANVEAVSGLVGYPMLVNPNKLFQ